VIDPLVKGDTVEFECEVSEDITGWKIRAELYSGGFSVKKATSNTGGSDNQIKVIDAPNGRFIIHFDQNETKNCPDTVTLEIEMETLGGKVYTVYQGLIRFKKGKIDWLVP